ncbi:MAG: hypothetical protein RMJ55_19895, partial [Roseiflexaceae bacterium]|nr:hypothetical protein [Roseiflexaceae bacterium]
YHLSPDAPAIDLLQNGDRIVYNLPFPEASQVVDASADRNQRDLQILPATVSKPVLVTFDSASLRADMVNDVFILNELAKIEVRVVPNAMLVAVPAELPRTGNTGEPFVWIVLALLMITCGVAVRQWSFAANPARAGGLRNRSPRLMEFEPSTRYRPVKPAQAGFATVARDFRRRASRRSRNRNES